MTKMKMNSDVFSSRGNPWVSTRDQDEYFVTEVQEVSRGIPDVGEKRPREFAPKRIIVRESPSPFVRYEGLFKGSDSRLKVVKATSRPSVRSIDSSFSRINMIRSAMAKIKK